MQQVKGFDLSSYQKIIEQELVKRIDALGPQNRLKEACEYVLMSKGKRVRPILTLMVAQSLGKGLDAVQASLAIEFFHTASLVADDLPCMDDEEERREKPTVHTVYGGAVALLSTYVFIAAGYESVLLNAQEMKKTFPQDYVDHVGMLAFECITRNAGIQGITGGQFLDIYPPNFKLETIKEILCKKTVTLFEIAFVLGWLFGGGDLSKLKLVEKAAYHLGMAFQIADDIEDREQDLEREGAVNIAVACGEEKAKAFFNEEEKLYLETLQKLEIATPQLVGLVDLFRP
mgnify:CR=1 FL=1